MAGTFIKFNLHTLLVLLKIHLVVGKHDKGVKSLTKVNSCLNTQFLRPGYSSNKGYNHIDF